MRKLWIFAGIYFSLVLFGAAWRLYCHVYPVPSHLLGVWENETAFGNAAFDGAGPGEVRLIISPHGSIDIQFDRKKYWGPDKLQIRVSGEFAEVWSEKGEKTKVRLELRKGRMIVSDPARPARADDVMIFKSVRIP